MNNCKCSKCKSKKNGTGATGNNGIGGIICFAGSFPEIPPANTLFMVNDNVFESMANIGPGYPTGQIRTFARFATHLELVGDIDQGSNITLRVLRNGMPTSLVLVYTNISQAFQVINSNELFNIGDFYDVSVELNGTLNGNLRISAEIST